MYLPIVCGAAAPGVWSITEASFTRVGAEALEIVDHVRRRQFAAQVDQMVGPQPPVSDPATMALISTSTCFAGSRRIGVRADARVEHRGDAEPAICTSCACSAPSGSSRRPGAAGSGSEMVGVQFDEAGISVSPSRSSPVVAGPVSMAVITLSRTCTLPVTTASASTIRALQHQFRHETPESMKSGSSRTNASPGAGSLNSTSRSSATGAASTSANHASASASR